MKKLVVLGALLVSSLSIGQQIQNDSIKIVVESGNEIYVKKKDLVGVSFDKYTGEKSEGGGFQDIEFLRYTKKGESRQYIRIGIDDSYLSGYSNSGVIILFKNGKKLIRPNEKVDVDYTSGDKPWSYSAFFTPTANEIALLKNNEIIGVRLHIFDKDITQGNAIKECAKLILKSPTKKKK